MSQTDRPLVILIAATSDIGIDMARRYVADGYDVIGTYRSTTLLTELEDLPHCDLVPLDITRKDDVRVFAARLVREGRRWRTVVSCVGDQRPVGRFFDTEFDDWESSVNVNFVHQLRVVHALYPSRDPLGANVVFFAGGGTNNPVPYYTGYTIAKIALIKMCELLDAEANDLNVFIVGPGWTRTKSHRPTLELDDPSRAGANYEKTRRFMESGDGTPLVDIYNCIQWLIAQGRAVAGGRNFSVVHDPWRGQPEWLAGQLRDDPNMFKLRRFRNVD